MHKIELSLETERILIRKLKLSDADDIYANIKGKVMARWTIALPHPYPQDGAVKYIRRTQRQWRAGKGYAFGIVSKETERVIGGASLARVDHKHKCGELGFWIARRHWSQGLTTEAVQLVLRFAFEQLKLHRIYASAFEANIASWRVLEKCGFKREGVMREAIWRYKKRHNFVNYGILKPEYQEASE